MFNSFNEKHQPDGFVSQCNESYKVKNDGFKSSPLFTAA